MSADTQEMRPLWVKSGKLQLPERIAIPGIQIDAGSVVRSIILAMCATSPLIQRKWPALPLDLAEGAPIELPNDMTLYLALARGVTARVAGPVAGFPIAGPHIRRGQDGVALGINAIASVYFPPLAWELVHAGETILDHHGWADVSSWTQLPPGEVHPLEFPSGGLPAVRHPWHDPSLSQDWAELLNSEMVSIVECANVEGGPPDPSAPLTLGKRAHVSIEEFKEMARRPGAQTPGP